MRATLSPAERRHMRRIVTVKQKAPGVRPEPARRPPSSPPTLFDIEQIVADLVHLIIGARIEAEGVHRTMIKRREKTDGYINALWDVADRFGVAEIVAERLLNRTGRVDRRIVQRRNGR